MLSQSRAAHAADTVVCPPQVSLLGADAAGALFLYPVSSPATTSARVETGRQIGSGWTQFGRVLAGPGGRVYGIKATGLYRYRWTGSTWAEQAKHLSPGFGGYAAAIRRDKITVDELGDIYLIDNDGVLRRYRYDDTNDKWGTFGQVLATGWDRYNLIVAGGVGVLYTRTPAGRLDRHRYDAASQRWIVEDKVVGSGWQANSPKGVVSVGGDVLFQLRGTGDLFHYRLREDNNAWVVPGRDLDNSWHLLSNVTAFSDGCKLSVSHTPARPATPVEQAAPLRVMQPKAVPGQPIRPIDYAYVNDIGRMLHGRQNPDDDASLRWTSLSDTEAFSGPPAMLTTEANVLRLFGRNTASDTWTVGEKTAGMADLTAWSNLGGIMKSVPLAVRLSDDKVALFALDAEGALWVRPQIQPSGDYFPWRKLGGGGFTGEPTILATTDRGATVLVTDSSGAVQTATYRDGVLAAWTSLGGSGLTGRLSAVPLLGHRLRLFARNADGKIMTQVQGTDGGFPGTWTQVGDLTAAGSPSAVLGPNTDLVMVVARDAEGIIHVAVETAQGSGQWRDWAAVTSPTETYLTDPTAVTFTTGKGDRMMFVVRTRDHQVRPYDLTNEGALVAGEGLRAAGTPPLPRFVARDIPQPPRD